MGEAKAQAQRSAAQTVTGTVAPVADTTADAAPAAEQLKRIDRTAVPVNTESASTEQEDTATENDAGAADTADIVIWIAEAYAADPMFADDSQTKRWMFLTTCGGP